MISAVSTSWELKNGAQAHEVFGQQKAEQSSKRCVVMDISARWTILITSVKWSRIVTTAWWILHNLVCVGDQKRFPRWYKDLLRVGWRIFIWIPKRVGVSQLVSGIVTVPWMQFASTLQLASRLFTIELSSLRWGSWSIRFWHAAVTVIAPTIMEMTMFVSWCVKVAVL